MKTLHIELQPGLEHGDRLSAPAARLEHATGLEQHRSGPGRRGSPAPVRLGKGLPGPGLEGAERLRGGAALVGGLGEQQAEIGINVAPSPESLSGLGTAAGGHQSIRQEAVDQAVQARRCLAGNRREQLEHGGGRGAQPSHLSPEHAEGEVIPLEPGQKGFGVVHPLELDSRLNGRQPGRYILGMGQGPGAKQLQSLEHLSLASVKESQLPIFSGELGRHLGVERGCQKKQGYHRPELVGSKHGQRTITPRWEAGDPRYSRAAMAARTLLALAGSAALALTCCAAEKAAVGSPPAPPTLFEVLIRAVPADRGGGWQPGEIETLAERLVGDPPRFVGDATFRSLTWNQLTRPLPREVSPDLARLLAAELNQYRGVDFAMSEALEHAWGLVPRRSLERRGEGPVRVSSDNASPIRASLYSLASWFFSAEESLAFLTAVRQLGREREIVALVDPELHAALTPAASSQRLRLLNSLGRGYSPWPRDPFSTGRTSRGEVVFLVRPNEQPEREEDRTFAQELIQNLPGDLDRVWGEPRWVEAPHPFHNGHMLVGDEALWLSLHSVETRSLELLRLQRVPVESFNQSSGVERYFAAVRLAAAELGEIFGRPARFVHPLPTGKDPERDRALIARLAGGAGFDLDSLLTLLELGESKRVALVADLHQGSELLRRWTPADSQALLERYQLRGDPASLLTVLHGAQTAPRSMGLQTFLDTVASELEGQGWKVRRLPLLRVPMSLRREREPTALPDFLIGWNNVVLERRGGGLQAEGFASLLPTADAEARRVFTAAGVELNLLPPLIKSVVLSGGYRCASNHIRAP